MTFRSIEALCIRMRELGATRLFCKALAENDNTKQQIYMGGSFEIIKLLPHRDIHAESGVKRPNFKAALDMAWIDDHGNYAPAPGAQLILYPDYPEVRLSGFVRGCPTAPSRSLQPVPKESRRFNNESDGRVLFFGVGGTGMAYTYLATAGSAIALEFIKRKDHGEFRLDGVLWHLPNGDVSQARSVLLEKLREIRNADWHRSQRMNRHGTVIEYVAQNGGGYTLEALLGIRPNACASPDFLGWEVKAYGGDKVTLMTPEPDAGYYGKNGVEAFVRNYGHNTGRDVLYFTGVHRVGETCQRSGQTLGLRGFDVTTRKITDVNGGIELIDGRSAVSAGWSFQGLMEHWSRKHSAAVYVPYSKRKIIPPHYRYNSPVLMGEGTDFTLYLGAISSGYVIYDPASKVMDASTKKSSVKARSQFRIPIRNLSSLYARFAAVEL